MMATNLNLVSNSRPMDDDIPFKRFFRTLKIIIYKEIINGN